MKAKCARLLPVLVKATVEAREKKAAELLDCEVVRVAVHQAAAAGQSAWRQRLPDGLGALNTTPAARQLTGWAKAEGLRLDWPTREATLPDGRRVTVADLEIGWMPAEF